MFYLNWLIFIYINPLMKIRTKNVIIDANKFRSINCKIIAEMYGFDLTNLTFKLRYQYELPTQMYGPDGTITDTVYNYETLIDFPNQIIDAGSINYLMDVLTVDLNSNGTYTENIQAVMHDILRIKVGMDGRFGLTPDDWEKI